MEGAFDGKVQEPSLKVFRMQSDKGQKSELLNWSLTLKNQFLSVFVTVSVLTYFD